MKITKVQLAELIKEELDNVLAEELNASQILTGISNLKKRVKAAEDSGGFDFSSLEYLEAFELSAKLFKAIQDSKALADSAKPRFLKRVPVLVAMEEDGDGFKDVNLTNSSAGRSNKPNALAWVEKKKSELQTAQTGAAMSQMGAKLSKGSEKPKQAQQSSSAKKAKQSWIQKLKSRFRKNLEESALKKQEQ